MSYQKLLKNYVLNQLHRRPPKSAKKKYLLRALKVGHASDYASVEIHSCAGKLLTSSVAVALRKFV